MAVEFRRQAGVPGLFLDRVIPDTGANASGIVGGDLLNALDVLFCRAAREVIVKP